MNLFKRTVAASALFVAAFSSAAAQWQVGNHATPIGRGAGVTGFAFAGPCNAGVPVVGAGASADPTCGVVGTAGGGTGVNNSTNADGDVLASNGANGNFVHTALASLLNLMCTAAPTVCTVFFGYANPVWWGADPTGSSDSAAAFDSAIGASTNIHFTPGKFKLLSSNSISVPSTGGYTVEGAGQNNTTLYWPSSNGLAVAFSAAKSSFHLRNLSLTTGLSNNTGTAVAFTQSGAYAAWGQSDISFVTCQGDDGPAATDFWQYCVDTNSVSGINFISDYFAGGTGSGGSGIGVWMRGTNSSLYGVVYNFDLCLFNTFNAGIQYGGFVQGVSISGSNFDGGIYAIHAPASGGGVLAQLAIVNSQFNTNAHQIFTETAVADTQVSNSIFFVPTGFAGLQLTQSEYPQITNNWFNGPGSGSTAEGVNIGGSPLVGTITGNIFRSLGIGVVLSSGATGMNVQSNGYSANGTTVLNSCGGGCTVGGGSQ